MEPRLISAQKVTKTGIAPVQDFLYNIHTEGANVGLTSQSIDTLDKIARTDYCLYLDASAGLTLPISRCQKMLKEMSKRGLVESLLQTINLISTANDAITAMNTTNTSRIIPVFNENDMGEVFRTLDYFNLLLIQAMNIISGDMKVYIDEVQRGILISTIAFYLFVGFVLLLVWTPFQRRLADLYFTPLRILMCLPMKMVSGNSYVKSFLKNRIRADISLG
eukprot:TRINITY_DN5093_c0_g1_i3.p1 TRINITY_DN5093_c0_g1~~TRINITY_DN5093_c0_g1_i3.p1  ORF type:complete len:221 (+),score=20.13 TRINITY_DN5093_c0_g1_i3:432-1094(+)